MVTAPVEEGQEIVVVESGQRIIAKEHFGAGHKVALVRIEAGENVIKYSIPVGRMTSAVDIGELVHVHNVEDTTEELLSEYCRQFRSGVRKIKEYPPKDDAYEPRKIKAYPRENGSFGIRNYIMVIPTTPACNGAAEAISDRTGCTWFVCDRTRLEGGLLTDYTRNAMIFTGRNPNIYAVLVIGSDAAGRGGKEISDEIAKTGKPVRYIEIGENDEQDAIRDGIAIIEGFQDDAAGLKRELVSMEGFGLALHCSGSDWTTAINGNSSVGEAADIIVRNNGRVFMTEWMEWSGSQHLMAEKCASYELGLELLDTLDDVRATVLRETGKPVEYMNPVQSNKDAGLTTLVEKSTGTISKIGSSQIRGLLDFCQQPTGAGVWLPKHASIWPPTTAIYSALSGAHMSVHITGVGFLYFELPHMVCVRTTGNPETFSNDEYKLDFNAGMVFDGRSIPEVGEILFEYLIRIVEGDEEPKCEHNKERAFNMYYYTENEFGEETDQSRMLYIFSGDYHEKRKQYTDSVK